ncbi:MAG: STAS domain-containing protein [Rudaea sp.]
MAIEIQIEQQDEIRILGLTGRLDTETAADVELAFADLLAAGAAVFVVDLSGIGYVSSAGLRVLLALAKKLDGGKGHLYLCGLSPAVRQVFDVAGFSKLFALFADRDAALKKAGKAAPQKARPAAVETAAADAAKAEVAAVEAARVEAAKAEAKKLAAAKLEAEKLAAARAAATDAEAARVEIAQLEAAKAEAAKREAAQLEAAKAEAARLAAAQAEAARIQAAKAEAERIKAAQASTPENVLVQQVTKLLGITPRSEPADPRVAALARSAALLLGLHSGPSGQVTKPPVRRAAPVKAAAAASPPHSDAPAAVGWKDKVRGLFGGKR